MLHLTRLDKRVTEEILFELFLQAGPVRDVRIITDRTGQSRGYAFVEYDDDVSATYACELLNDLLLFGTPLKVSPATGSVLAVT